MKTLHVAYSFPPDAPGGTEIYVRTLAHSLEQSGIRAIVAAPAAVDASYRHDGLDVRRFATVQTALRIDDLYGRGDTRAAEAFDALLAREQPDVVHQHALTAACSVQLVERAKRRSIPVVFTYHTPTVSCQRGSLLENGTTVCDGRLDTARCTACSLQGHGVGARTSRLLARTPTLVGDITDRAGLSGGAWTAIRMRALTNRRIDTFGTFLTAVDRFVALAPWVRALLQANGVSSARIVDCPHGLPAGDVPRRTPSRRVAGRLRLAHVGRIDPLKGTSLLIEALLGLRDAPIDIDIFAVVQADADVAMRDELMARTQPDSRIHWREALPHDAMCARLAEYDLVAVPSQWMETGPLVVLEAFAAGVPVLGSRLGGIADKVRDGVDGLLVAPHDSLEAWRSALARLVDQPGLAVDLARGIRPVRSSVDVASEMASLYTALLDHAGSPATLPSHGIGAVSRP